MNPGLLRTAVEIRNPRGLHMRFAAAFAEGARSFTSTVAVVSGGSRVDGKSWISLILLAAEPGTSLGLEVEGSDAVMALPVLAELLNSESVDEWDKEPDLTGN